MSNKRDLKKEVRYVCGDLAAETIIAGHMLKGFTPEVVTDIVGDIARLQVTTLAHATFSFDKTRSNFESDKQYNKARAAYNREAYARVRQDFKKGVESVLAKMNDARKA